MSSPPGSSPVHRLEALLARAGRRGPAGLDGEELLELGRLYRQAGALLARARTAGLQGPDTEHLNRLLARVYPLVHGAPRRQAASPWRLLLVEFPRAVRQEWRYIAAAVIIFLAGALAGAAAVEIDPSSADLLLGPHWRTGLEEVARRHMDGQDWLPAPLRPAASAEIMVNNVQVSFLAFASGVLLCLGSLYVMGFNGILMGAVAGIVHRHGVDLPFWGFVAPHGAIELPAIMIAGGAGMVMGWSLLRPGRLLRREALRLAARRAVVLLMGVVVMLALAGVIEGFLSPRVDLPDGFKLALGGGIFACLAGWLGLAGRGAARPSGPVWKQPHPLFDLPAAGEAEALEAGPAGAKGKAPELSAPESAW